ncbi:hypothetical protein ACOTVO_07935 [Aliarcobacter butzleri]|uniref:hypothetical protein n=1 Tax=Aliarcobacter butzleri TaxID=28197 RepID=UPI000F467844|nr:hypothetical protein [Aliarcobacter butzleri]MCT7634840.1 immunoglobulin domain-containing protein [Aliarcobacter butzleri]MDN5093077.1 hypothetical protein [Aliarcobacter butzleri]RZV13481.1 hypothetical protein D3M61_08230 [Aliarcobacter butzleri]
MSNLIKKLIPIVTIIAGIATIIGLYLQINQSSSIILEVKTISRDNLTKIPNVDGLQATYSYKNEEIKSLWKIHYIITNIGNEIIIGEGNKKNIIKDSINLKLIKDFKILEIESKNKDFECSISNDINNIYISFLQWKPKENLELILYLEQLNSSLIPEITTSDREIINSEIKYSTFGIENLDSEKTIYDRLPQYLQPIIWWLTLIFYGLFLILIPIAWLSEVIKYIKYVLWIKSNNNEYNEWINNLIQENKLSQYSMPITLPQNIWNTYPSKNKPELPAKDFKNQIWAYLILLLLFVLPLLFVIKI